VSKTLFAFLMFAGAGVLVWWALYGSAAAKTAKATEAGGDKATLPDTSKLAGTTDPDTGGALPSGYGVAIGQVGNQTSVSNTYTLPPANAEWVLVDKVFTPARGGGTGGFVPPIPAKYECVYHNSTGGERRIPTTQSAQCPLSL
jgi:hypothetical protein